MQNLQPSQSFKYRGLSLFAQQSKEKHGPDVHLIIASGGNAGLAAACAANVLSVRCTVYITEGVSQKMHDFLRKELAEVVIVGKYYVQTLEQAEEAVKREENAYVSAWFFRSYAQQRVSL
jgi:L-serine/L-threonine ammonia-lyase